MIHHVWRNLWLEKNIYFWSSITLWLFPMLYQKTSDKQSRVSWSWIIKTSQRNRGSGVG